LGILLLHAHALSKTFDALLVGLAGASRTSRSPSSTGTAPLSFQRPCRPALVLDITGVYGVKQQALQAHGSQYGPILFAVDIAARYYGRMINVGYGEGFLHKEPLPLTRDLAIV
jgi:LmbE family N-acetylglucosaminyl deacetylase